MADTPTDFNDLAVLVGGEAVRDQINQALRALQQRSVAGGSGTADDGGDWPADLPDDVYLSGDYSNPADEFQPREADWYATLDLTKGHNGSDGVPKGHVGNVERILQLDPRWQGVLAYCDFSYRVLFEREPPSGWSKKGELTDDDIARLRVWLHRQYWMPPPSRSDIADAVLVVAQRNRAHPVRSYLAKLRWDGTERLGNWLVAAFDAGARKEEGARTVKRRRDYLRLIGEKFLVGAVARVMGPGCKMDNVLILEGDQGKGKSTALGALFGEAWFSDAPLPLGEKDAYQLIQGVWGYEMAELDAFNKSETTSAKAFFSQRRDRFRPPYGHAVSDYPRQTLFMGTTNQDEYLKDYSGNRRYWPVYCRSADVEWVRVNRDQLWAEALQKYRDEVVWWVADDRERKLCEAEQDARLQRDPWEDALLDFLASSTGQYYSAYDLLTQAIKLDAGHITRAHQNRLAPIMKTLEWPRERRRLPQYNGERRWVYVRPNELSTDDLPDGEVEF